MTATLQHQSESVPMLPRTRGRAGPGARGRAFTLLEVLVALAIIGLVLPPLLINAAERIHGLTIMEQKIVANLVAQNQLALVRLNARLGGSRPPRREDGTEFMAGRDWFWLAETEQTEVDGYFRIEIRVATDKKMVQPVARVSAYLGVE